MIERHVTFEVLPEKTDEFKKMFVEEYRPAMASMSGYINVDLLRELEKPAVFHMVIRFRSLESADAWRASTAHQSLSPRLKALYSQSQLHIYEVVA